MPEKSLRQIDAAHMAHAFAVNAIGPALLMKHVTPLLAGQGKAVFATLSARVGSIGDNRMGGWHAYRASKAALNQIVRTVRIELARTQAGSHLRRPSSRHGGKQPVGTFRQGRARLSARAREAARDLLSVLDGLGPRRQWWLSRPSRQDD